MVRLIVCMYIVLVDGTRPRTIGSECKGNPATTATASDCSNVSQGLRV
jgi:hypothetical protein